MSETHLVLLGKVENKDVASVRNDIVRVRDIYERTPVHQLTDRALGNIHRKFSRLLQKRMADGLGMDELESYCSGLLARHIIEEYNFRVSRYYLVFSLEAADATKPPLFPGGEEYALHKMLRHISPRPEGCEGTVIVYDGHAMLSEGIDFFLTPA